MPYFLFNIILTKPESFAQSFYLKYKPICHWGQKKSKRKLIFFLLSNYALANQPDNSLDPNGTPKNS